MLIPEPNVEVAVAEMLMVSFPVLPSERSVPGVVVPMPTLPFPSITILTLVVMVEEDAIANRLFVTSYPTDQTSFALPPVKPIVAAVAL